jgi:hypothetical protein
MVPEAFKQFSCSRSRNPSPTKRPRLQTAEEIGRVIVAAKLCWDTRLMMMMSALGQFERG